MPLSKIQQSINSALSPECQAPVPTRVHRSTPTSAEPGQSSNQAPQRPLIRIFRLQLKGPNIFGKARLPSAAQAGVRELGNFKRPSSSPQRIAGLDQSQQPPRHHGVALQLQHSPRGFGQSSRALDLCAAGCAVGPGRHWSSLCCPRGTVVSPTAPELLHPQWHQRTFFLSCRIRF